MTALADAPSHSDSDAPGNPPQDGLDLAGALFGVQEIERPLAAQACCRPAKPIMPFGAIREGLFGQSQPPGNPDQAIRLI